MTSIQCDGCGRKPNLWEWLRGELTDAGYAEWRHPGLAFREAGYPLTHATRARCEALFYALFGRALPEDAGFLCPQCQDWTLQQLPPMIQHDLDRTQAYY